MPVTSAVFAIRTPYPLAADRKSVARAYHGLEALLPEQTDHSGRLAGRAVKSPNRTSPTARQNRWASYAIRDAEHRHEGVKAVAGSGGDYRVTGCQASAVL